MSNTHKKDTMGNMRNVVLGMVENQGRLLVYRGLSPRKGLTYHRPLGGTIEHGEHSRDALRREFQEELGTGIEILSHLGVIEDIFDWDGGISHQVFFLYRIRLLDPKFASEGPFQVLDEKHVAFWKDLSSFQTEDRLLPTGLLDHLRTPKPLISLSNALCNRSMEGFY